MTRTPAVLAVPSETRQLWARNLKTARTRAGYATQGEFARALGCTRAAVSSWERGLRAPSYDHRQRIAALVGRKHASLFPAA